MPLGFSHPDGAGHSIRLHAICAAPMTTAKRWHAVSGTVMSHVGAKLPKPLLKRARWSISNVTAVSGSTLSRLWLEIKP